MSDSNANEDSPWETGEGITSDLAVAEKVAAALSQMFHTFRQRQIVCCHGRRGSGFWHCKASSALAAEGGRLCDLLEKLALLRLLADCEARVASFRRFVLALERLALDDSEHGPASPPAGGAAGGWSEDDDSGGGRTGMAHISNICDELRTHLTHWSCLSRCALESPRLRLRLQHIEPALAEARAVLARLRHASICWLERLARAGVRAFARSGWDSATMVAEVCTTVHGIEEFNALLATVGRTLALEDCALVGGCHHTRSVASGGASATRNYLRRLHVASTNTPSQVDLRTIKSMSFVRFLGALAAERAKIKAARSLHALLNQSGGAADGSLRTTVALHAIRAGGGALSYKRVSNFVTAATGDRTDTSDYHSATGSAVSVPAGRQSRKSITELSAAERELLQWTQSEQEYVGKVIAIACHMTTMLQKSAPKGSALRNTDSPMTSSSGSCPSKADGKRKSVSWGDSHDSTVKTNLVNKYSDLMWKSFGGALSDCAKNSMAWGRVTPLTRRAAAAQQPLVGSVDFCKCTTVLKYAHSLESLSSGGALPSSCARQLDLAALRLEASAMLAQWDMSICVVLASAQADKCQPVPLADGQYSSRTAVLLRNAFGTLQNLQLAFEKRFGARRKGIPASQQPATEYRIQWEILQRLQILADLAEQWCQQKCTHYIHDYRLSPFLLVTYSDLPILATELGKCLCLLSCDGHTGSADPFPAQWHRLSVAFGRTEALARTAEALLSKKSARAASEFFTSSLPPPKTWRKDASAAAEKAASSYVADLTESLLQPLLDGCRQLVSTAQAATIVCVVRSILEAWTQQLLKQKVKFSWDGADQLEADVRVVREWISTNVGSDEVKRTILEAEPFRVITGIVQLLKRQPRKLSSGSSSLSTPIKTPAAGQTTPSDSANDGIAPSGNHDSLDEMDYASAVPDKSAWLSLRQRGPGRAARLFLPCMNSQSATLAL